MGMSNYIEAAFACPNCGEEVEWQSKDVKVAGVWIPNVMWRMAPQWNMDAEMYAGCDGCFHWHDADIVNGEIMNVRSRFLPHHAEQAARKKA
jgi:hypothetical protein